MHKHEQEVPCQKAPSFKLSIFELLTSPVSRAAVQHQITVRTQPSHTQLELELKLCMATLSLLSNLSLPLKLNLKKGGTKAPPS